MHTTRREILQSAAAVGLAAMAARTGAQSAPASRPRVHPTVGIQIDANHLAQPNLDATLDDLAQRAGVNTLFPFIYTHVATQAGVPAQGFRGGNFAMPHMQFYKNTPLTFEDMRGTEFGNGDLLERTISTAKKHGIRTFAWILEDNSRLPNPAWQALYEVDFHGQRAQAHPGGPCYNNPAYRGFLLGLVEDYCRSYDIDGVMWSSERQGGLFNALGAYHNGARADPGQATCFCEFCTRRARADGIDPERARKAFAALETFVRDGRVRKKPRDGFFVAFFRLLLNYPELLAWESLWIRSRAELQTKLYTLVKSIKKDIPVGWHIWHNVSFSPFHRAEMDYAAIAQYSDFIKPVLYSNCAGERIKSFTDSVGANVFGDLPPAQSLDMLYAMLDYKEAAYDRVTAAGFSPDYVARETRRTLDDVAGADHPVQVWPGIDIDVPVPAGASRCTPEYVRQCVLAAFKAGAQGVVLSRNYAEMTPANLAGAGQALKDLGYQ